MPTLSTIGLFALAALALLLVPGPSVLYIVTRSIDQGRKAGLVSVAGIHVGSLVHVAAATVGLSALLVASSTAFTAIKLAGAAYLIALGLRRLFGPIEEERAEAPITSLRRTFGHGIVVNVLNPKTALFFLAFLPQFIDPERGPVAAQTAVLGLCFIGLGACTDSGYAVLASVVGQRLQGRRTQRVSGGIYVGLGVTAALAGGPRRTSL